LSQCPVPKIKGNKNRDLLEWALSLENSLKQCNLKLEAIRKEFED
jgi:hypothetical protein